MSERMSERVIVPIGPTRPRAHKQGCTGPLPHDPRPGGMREAIESAATRRVGACLDSIRLRRYQSVQAPRIPQDLWFQFRMRTLDNRILAVSGISQRTCPIQHLDEHAQ